jgi:hypothetical protein
MSSEQALLDEVFEAIVVEHTEGVRQDEVAMARREYEERRGRVFEDEALWERYSQAFLEWYVLERITEGSSFPPAASTLAALRGRDGAERHADAMRAWLTSHRSLFEVRALHDGRVELIDLLGGARFAVAEPRALHGVTVGDVAELRVIGFCGSVLFGRTFLFHPTGTRPAITALARRVIARGGDRREIMDTCASLRVRCERYKHVDAVRLYEAAADGRAGGFGAAAGAVR